MNEQTASASGLKTGINIGSSSLLMIFVILCLVSFAALSIVSANADYKLSARMLERTTAYYEACNQAESNIARIDATLQEVYKSCSSEEEYFSIVGRFKAYAVPISDIQTLEVIVDILYPAVPGEPLYSIRSWQAVTTGELEYEDTLPLLR